MRLPKRVIINGRVFRVVKDPKSVSSHFSYKDMAIWIGARPRASRGILDGFVHEIAEISSVERNIRHERSKGGGGNGDYMFVADHDQFDAMCADLATIVGDLMKL